MEDEIKPFIQQYGISVDRRYIDGDAALEKMYGDKVPVLTVHDKIICHYFLDTDILLKAITDNAIAEKDGH